MKDASLIPAHTGSARARLTLFGQSREPPRNRNGRRTVVLRLFSFYHYHQSGQAHVYEVQLTQGNSLLDGYDVMMVTEEELCPGER